MALSAAFFLSGAAGLIFEVVWFYRCGLVFGNSVWAASVVLAAFMGGLALGTAAAGRFGSRTRRLIDLYARLELAVAASGVAITYLLPVLAPLVRGGTAVRAAGAFLVLIVPATAMGATLPVIVGAASRANPHFTRVLGRLYGINTLGAVCGVIAAELWLIARFGIAGTGWIAAGLNVSAATVAWLAHWTARERVAAGDAGMTPGQPRLTMATDERRPVSSPLLVCACASGAALLALEVLWFRFVSMYVLTTTVAMSLMLAVVLASIAVGGLAAALWARRSPRAWSHAPAVAFAMASSVALSYWLFGWVTSGTQIGDWRRVLWFTAVEAAPTSMLSGVLFTLLGGALQRRVPNPTRAAARLTVANTIGGMAGAPAAAFVLLPYLGLERSFFAAAFVYALLAALLLVSLGRDGAPVRSRGVLVPAAAAILLILAFPFGRMASNYFPRAAEAYAMDQSAIIDTREGPSETIFVMAQPWLGRPVYHRLITNGFSMSGTAVPAMRYMRGFAYLPMLVHDGPMQNALVICYGVGVTASAVADIASLKAIDVVEISKDVVAASDVIYPPDRRPLRDPRVRLHLEDGRYFLQSTRDRFDLITGEPPPPRNPGAVNIYTREYFQLIHDRLNAGGLATYWVPVGRPNPGTDVDTIIRAFCDVFVDCSLWNGTPFDFMLMGSRSDDRSAAFAAAPPIDAKRFSQPWQSPGVQAKLREVGFEQPEQIGATFLGDAAYLRELTTSTPPLIDDFPQRLRPAADRPSLSDPRYGVNPEAAERFQQVLDPERARDLFTTSPYIRRIWPAELMTRTLPFFDVQRIINRVLFEGGHPLAQIDDLDLVLTDTRLRTLPLWILGSDDVKQQIAESSTERSSTIEYARALRAISGRDFQAAAMRLAHAEQLGLDAPTVRALLVYSLWKLNRIDEARHLAQTARPRTDEETHFWEWMKKRLVVRG